MGVVMDRLVMGMVMGGLAMHSDHWGVYAGASKWRTPIPPI